MTSPLVSALRAIAKARPHSMSQERRIYEQSRETCAKAADRIEELEDTIIREPSPPTIDEVRAEYARLFPAVMALSQGRYPCGNELAFIAVVLALRAQGVGYGFMRQALGIIWKMEDPIGYIDDDRIIELHERRKRNP